MYKEANLYFHLVYSLLPKPETSVLRSLRTKNSRLVHMLDTTYRLNYPGVQMTSDIFYQGNLQAPQEIMDRRLMFVDGKQQSSYSSSNRELRKIIDPDNSVLYVGVPGLETECGLSYDNHAQAMTVYDLCTGFIQLGVLPSRISVIAPYSPHVKTIRTLLDGTGVSCNPVHTMLGSKNDMGFMIQPELLNVATSRQPMKLIIVGDVGETFAEGCDASRKMYDFISSKGSLVTTSMAN